MLHSKDLSLPGPTMRPLDSAQDAELVLDLHRRAADYHWLESGRQPSPELVGEFFADAPPGGDAATSLKLGLFDGDRLLGLADLAFGYPESGDAYIGLLMLAPEARGGGYGSRYLRKMEDAARRRGATRLLITVLEANPRARAFWEREGFGTPMVYPPPTPIGDRLHVCIRLEKPL